MEAGSTRRRKPCRVRAVDVSLVTKPTVICTLDLPGCRYRKGWPDGYRSGRKKAILKGEEQAPVPTKETVRALLDRLPDDCSLDDVLYHLYVIQTVEEGRVDAEAGRTLSHQEVAEALRRKWLVGAGK